MLSSWKFYCCSQLSQRWIFAILGCIGLCIQSISSIIMSIVIIEMVEQTDNCKDNNASCESSNNSYQTDNGSIERYKWDAHLQGIILSSFFWSSTTFTFFSGTLAERYGGKHLLGFGILSQSIITFVTPFLTNWGGSTALIITRVLTGAFSGSMPIYSVMLSKWTTIEERTSIANIIFSGYLLGTFIGSISPALIIKYSGMGWPSVFYVVAILGIIWFPLWFLFVHESPDVHPFISDKELKYLQVENNKQSNRRLIPTTPWKSILMCKEFWAYTLNFIGANWAFYVMYSGMPQYMNNVLKFSLENNGYFSSLPYLFMWLNTILSAWLSDKILENHWLSLTNVRQLLTTVATIGPALFLIIGSYFGQDNKITVVVMFVIGITLTGSSYPSAMMSPLDLSPNYAGSIMSVSTGLALIVAILAPYFLGILVPNSTLMEWRYMFWYVFVISVLSSIIYVVWYKAKVQPWNEPDSLTNGEVSNVEAN